MNFIPSFSIKHSLLICSTFALPITIQAGEVNPAAIKEGAQALIREKIPEKIPAQSPYAKLFLAYTYDGDVFPRADLEKELSDHKKFFIDEQLDLPVTLTNAFNKKKLTEGELVFAVRFARLVVESVKKIK